jgi:hypothetical protein
MPHGKIGGKQHRCSGKTKPIAGQSKDCDLRDDKFGCLAHENYCEEHDWIFRKDQTCNKCDIAKQKAKEEKEKREKAKGKDDHDHNLRYALPRLLPSVHSNTNTSIGREKITMTTTTMKKNRNPKTRRQEIQQRKSPKCRNTQEISKSRPRSRRRLRK